MHPEELAKRSEEVNGCWVWMGSHTAAGYGNLKRNGTYWLVHRLAYSLLVGPLVDGLEIDHLCRNRACWNPEHLEQVPHAVNVNRGEGGWTDNARALGAAARRAKNATKTHCKNGHERTPENSYVYPSGRAACIGCRRLWKKNRPKS